MNTNNITDIDQSIKAVISNPSDPENVQPVKPEEIVLSESDMLLMEDYKKRLDELIDKISELIDTHFRNTHLESVWNSKTNDDVLTTGSMNSIHHFILEEEKFGQDNPEKMTIIGSVKTMVSECERIVTNEVYIRIQSLKDIQKQQYNKFLAEQDALKYKQMLQKTNGTLAIISETTGQYSH